MVLPGSNVIAMLLGGLPAEILRRAVPRFASSYVVPLASGLIAAESLMGVAIVALESADVMPLE